MLIKTKIPSFVVNQEPSTPHNLLMGVKTIWELRLFQVAPFVSFQGLQMGIFVFWTEGVAMATPLRVSFYLFCDAHLCCQVSRTLLQYFQRYCLLSILPFLVANNMTSSLHNRKTSISLKRKKIMGAAFIRIFNKKLVYLKGS